MAATLVGQNERERTKFEHCQVEADETAIRKERIYEVGEGGTKKLVGTKHHSVMCLTGRGSTQTVVYGSEPVFVPVDKNRKQSRPPLPTTELVLPMLSRHFGDCVVLHTDGADASSRLRTTEGGCGAQSGPVHSFRLTRCHWRSAMGKLSVRPNKP